MPNICDSIIYHEYAARDVVHVQHATLVRLALLIKTGKHERVRFVRWRRTSFENSFIPYTMISETLMHKLQAQKKTVLVVIRVRPSVRH